MSHLFVDRETVETLKFYAMRSDSKAWKLLIKMGYSFTDGEWVFRTQKLAKQ